MYTHLKKRIDRKVMYMGNKNGRYIHNNEIENASYLNLKNSSKSYFSACFEYNIYDKVITINIA